MATAGAQHSSLITQHSAFRAFVALVLLTFRRHWRVRALGWVTAGLVGLTSVALAVFTHGPVGWRLEDRPARIADARGPGDVRMTHREYALERLPFYQSIPGPMHQFPIVAIPVGAYQWLLLSDHPDAVRFRDDYAFERLSRWVVFGLFLGFVLPLFTLAYASGAIGAEREGRTLVWLHTRPLPRPAVYLAKLLGVLPWCVAVSMAAFAVLCLSAGELGLRALAVYWPGALAGAVGLSALFHLIGAVFRRPAVVGLVYVFFFETLVANLPGSLKRLSLNYYVKSLMYNEATAAAGAVAPENLDVYAPVASHTAWLAVLLAAAGLTLLGMRLFARQEPRDET
jgi:hypothetical protein